MGSNQGPTGYEPVALTSELMAHLLYVKKLVGVAGFEPAAHWSQTSCATKLRYTPIWQGQKDSNPRHAVLETAALPTELYP